MSIVKDVSVADNNIVQPKLGRAVLRNMAAILLVGVLLFGIGYGLYSTRLSNSRQADFTITTSSPVSTGSVQTSTVLVRSLDGFNGKVSLQALPPDGVTCKGLPGSSQSTVIFVPGSWTLECRADNAGNYLVTVSATSGDTSQTATVLFHFGDNYRGTSVGFVCDPSTIIVNQTTTCRVSLSDSSLGAKISPTGTVNLATQENPTLLVSTCTIQHTSCLLNYTSSTIGNVQLVANYTGDGTHRPVQTTTVVVVETISTVTSLNCNPSIVTLQSGPTICTVNVTSQENNETLPSGAVMFGQVPGGNVTPSICTLVNGACSVQYAPVSGIGSFVLTATYTGDHSHSSSIGQFTISVSLAPTTTTLACNPSIVMNNASSQCTVTVTDNSSSSTAPTGYVQMKCSSACSTMPATLCALAANSPKTSTCIFTVASTSPTTIMTVFSNYQGDTVHASSSAQATLTITRMPATVTVSGHATTTDQCFQCKATRLQFVNKNTGAMYDATVTSSNYSISLANMQSYNVIMYWTGWLGTTNGSCTGAVLDLHQSTNTLTVDYRC